MNRWQTMLAVVGGAGCLLATIGVERLPAADVQPAPLKNDDRYIEIPLSDRPPTSGRTKAAAPAPPRDSNPQIDALIVQLGDADFRKREAAVAKLKGMGPTVLPALKRAVDQATDPEIVSRAEGVIRFMERPHVPGGSSDTKTPSAFGGPIGRLNLRMQIENGVRKVQVIEQNGRIVRIESGPNGINMAVTGVDEDGDRVTRQYQARTPDELRQQNPEAFELFQRWGQRGAFQPGRRGPVALPRPRVQLLPPELEPGAGDPMLEMEQLLQRGMDPAGADAAARHLAEITGMLEQLRRRRAAGVDPFDDGIGQRLWRERQAAQRQAQELERQKRALDDVDAPDDD